MFFTLSAKENDKVGRIFNFVVVFYAKTTTLTGPTASQCCQQRPQLPVQHAAVPSVGACGFFQGFAKHKETPMVHYSTVGHSSPVWPEPWCRRAGDSGQYPLQYSKEWYQHWAAKISWCVLWDYTDFYIRNSEKWSSLKFLIFRAIWASKFLKSFLKFSSFEPKFLIFKSITNWHFCTTILLYT